VAVQSDDAVDRTYPAAIRAAGYGAAILPQLLQHAIRYAGDVHAA